jgi:hypothetical protein
MAPAAFDHRRFRIIERSWSSSSVPFRCHLLLLLLLLLLYPCSFSPFQIELSF